MSRPPPCQQPPALPPMRSLCMMTAAAPGDPSNLHDWATRRKEDAGMPSYFSPAVHAVPPLVDIPQQIVSDVLFGGLAPQGGSGRLQFAVCWLRLSAWGRWAGSGRSASRSGWQQAAMRCRHPCPAIFAPSCAACRGGGAVRTGAAKTAGPRWF